MNSKKLLLLTMLCIQYPISVAAPLYQPLLPVSGTEPQKKAILERITKIKSHRQRHKTLSRSSFYLVKVALNLYYLSPLLPKGLTQTIIFIIENIFFGASILIGYHGTATHIYKLRKKKAIQNLMKTTFRKAEMNAAIVAIGDKDYDTARKILGLAPRETEHLPSYLKLLCTAHRSLPAEHYQCLAAYQMYSDVETASAKDDIACKIQSYIDREKRFRRNGDPLARFALTTCFALCFFPNYFLQRFQNHHPKTDWPLIILKGLHITEIALFAVGLLPLFHRCYEMFANRREISRIKYLIKETIYPGEITRALSAIEDNKASIARQVLGLTPEQTDCLPVYHRLLCEVKKKAQ